MGQIIVNNATTTIDGAISNVATSVTLLDASDFPDPGSDYYLATLVYINPASGSEENWEIVKVTAKSGSVLTITRAQEGTSASAWDDATPFQVRITAGSLTLPDNVAITGGNIDGTVIGGTTTAAASFAALDASSVQLTGGTGTQGTLSWNTDEQTIDLDQNGAVLQLGQEIHIQVRNNTASQIVNGTPVMSTGTIGASGRITIAPMDASVLSNEYKLLGFTTEDIDAGSDGKVTYFGKVRNINTAGYSAGDILWLDSGSAGAVTTTEPTTGIKIPAALVVTSASNGTLFVRPQASLGFHDLHDFDGSVVPVDNDVIAYDSTSSTYQPQSAAEAGLATSAQGTLADTAMQDLVDDATPQLGGQLDANGNSIDMGVNTITDTKVGQWDTAFSWGNHASASYLTAVPADSVGDSELNTSNAGTDGYFLRWNTGGTISWEAVSQGSTYSAGTGLDLIGTTFNLDFSELTDMTADISGTTEFIIQDGTTESRKAASEIKLSNFNNDAGWTANVGDITGVTAGTGLSGGGASGSVTLNLDFSELTDMTADIISTTEFVLQNGAVESRKAASEIKLSVLNNDAGWTSNAGDITNVTADAPLTGGGTSGAVSLGLGTTGPGAGTYGSTANGTKIDQITLDAYGRVTAITTGATGTATVDDTGTPAILSDGNVPSLNTNITAAEVRSLIGAGTGDGSGTVTSVSGANGISGTVTTSGSLTLDSDLRGHAWQIGRDNNDYYIVNTTTHSWYLDAAEDMRLDNSGNLYVEGNVTAYSTTVSDARLKDNVETINGALEKVCALRGVSYNWNAGSRKGERDIGVIAQEVQAVIPEVVREVKDSLIDGGDYLSVGYDQLVPVLIEAVKQLKAELDELKGER